MESEQRLHPWSILFALGKYLKEFALTGAFVLVGSTASGRGTPWWFLLPFVGGALLLSIARQLSFRFRYDPDQLVLRWGFLFRTERHIPYGKIQNIDAVQNVVHRALGVATVQIQTGSGSKAEAALSVVPLRVLDEMRERVSRNTKAAPVPETDSPSVAPPPALHLSDWEVLLAGFILSRGFVVVGAILGLGYELGLIDGFITTIFGDGDAGAGVMRDIGRSVADGAPFPVEGALIGGGVIVAGLFVMRIVAMIWRAIQWHGFRISRVGDDLHSSYGMFTKVSAIVPARRVQSVTIEERWLHRRFGRVSIRITSAAGVDAEQPLEKKWLAPLIRRDHAAALIAELLPEFRLDLPTWHAVHPRAFARVARLRVIAWAVLILPFWALIEWRAAAIWLVVATWAVWGARQQMHHRRWTSNSTGVAFARGWLTRLMTLVRYDRIQSVTHAESPWDRRAGMAGVSVDVAGGGHLAGVGISYLARDTAGELAATLDRKAADTEFSW